jgi:hypothetical protein
MHEDHRYTISGTGLDARLWRGNGVCVCGLARIFKNSPPLSVPSALFPEKYQ